MNVPTTVAALTTSAARVFRGHCMTAQVGTIDIAGARIPATTYTFRVSEHLKGTRRRTITFRQAGVPDGGARDLGRLVGLPAYAPGTEYVLFLLPPSGVGLTSPAGAAEGAFVVRDGRVQGLRRTGIAPVPAAAARARAKAPAVQSRSYEELRRAVLDALAP